jgi:hypothetical protein
MSNASVAAPDDGSSDFIHNPTWRVFRIMSEFVEGFTFLASIQRSVTIFGSARLPEGTHYYQLARMLGRRLAIQGFTVVTGGGPGIMQAGNQGAVEGGGESVGLNIQLPREQGTNPYVRQGASFHYFFSRKVMLDFSAEAYVFFPGGFGTLDEFFELVTLLQTDKMDRVVPIVLIGREFWEPLIAWMETVMVQRMRTVAPEDLHLWQLTDDLDEAMRIIEEGVRQRTEHEQPTSGTPAAALNAKLRHAGHVSAAELAK